MTQLLTLLKRPLLHVAGLSFFVNLLPVPAILMLQGFDRVLATQSGETLLMLMAAFTRMPRQAVQVVILGLGAWLVIHGEATAGIMIATPALLGHWRVLAEGRAAFHRLGELLAAADAEPQRMSLSALTTAVRYPCRPCMRHFSA